MMNTYITNSLNKPLQLGEQYIIKYLENENLNDMLDIGIGGGRTTNYFNHLFKNYYGQDLSNMYNNHWKKIWPNLNFEGGISFLNYKTDKTLDFVLFSHNGIDYSIDINDWINSVNKMYNLSVKYFAFSSHNIFWQNKYAKKEYCIVNETVCKVPDIFTIYTNPHFIIKTINKLKFKNFKIINRKGVVLDYNDNIDSFCNKNRDNIWLYYFIEK